jgi:hypothetical protein
MLEERFSTIERENRILLEKMSHIMTHNTLDNHNTSVKYAHSLNREYRKRELYKITRENMAILKRIQQSEPTYNHYKWEAERRDMEGLINNLCEFRRPHTSVQRSGRGRSQKSFQRPRTRAQGNSMDMWDSPSNSASRLSSSQSFRKAGASVTRDYSMNDSYVSGMGANSSGAPMRQMGGDILLHSERRTLPGTPDPEAIWEITVVEKGTVSVNGQDCMAGLELWGRQGVSGAECAVGLTADNLKELLARAGEPGLMAAWQAMREVDGPSVVTRLSAAAGGDALAEVHRYLIDRLNVVLDGDSLAFQLLA